MSGLEIGGVVLGAFPLVIAAIERYEQGLEILRLWDARKYQSELRAIRLEMKVQEVLFRNSYTKLLLSFLDQSALIRVLADPNGLRKESAAITALLKGRLGDHWEAYDGLVKRLENTLVALRLSVERNQLASDNWKAQATSLLNRIRFSFSIKQRSGLLERLKSDNWSFALLTDQQDALKQSGHYDSNVKVSAYQEVRVKALNFLATVVDNLRCEEECDYQHSASLLLNPSVVLIEDAEWKDSTDYGPSIALQGLDKHHHPRKSVWCLTQCPEAGCVQKSFCNAMKSFPTTLAEDDCLGRDRQRENDPNSLAVPRPFAKISNHSRCSWTPYNPRYISQGGGRRTYLRDRGGGLTNTPVEPNFSSWRQPEGIPLGQSGAELSTEERSLARYREKSSANKYKITLCLQHPSQPSVHEAIKLCDISKAGQSISLFEILSADRAFTRFPRYFYERDRVRLAIMGASAVLSLQSSPWLKSSWSSKDILFDTELGDVDERKLLHPYLQRPLLRQTNSRDIFQQQNEPDCPGFGIQNSSLYSLGMFLMELILNETLASLRKDDREPEVQTAWRVEREVCGKAGPRWADIISKCLHCPFPISPNFENPQFVSVIYREVLQPLIEMSELRTLRDRRPM
ncbi:hypothetical protein FQN54_001155 [Arachnomyces sp. PD_36]|nr:hypothetical protein FQN54_001155 [Arachnomyces sp. PD_36]